MIKKKYIYSKILIKFINSIKKLITKDLYKEKTFYSTFPFFYYNFYL